ncbi:YihY/virulence factor BrkB family protein [Chitinophaga horti]|uniref:YihY/virulence factor BrkB family protein n=1 Tax=Chitinophaga horti TaxID=2920382 RepID=A0ABY6IUM5_9BACT|nr:YihY/virulence factor BrkB family protein [Chitinophaga horti]UYQ91083.1 YihY/virulence factor BrkB family protein [Chitinophaga horti]
MANLKTRLLEWKPVTSVIQRSKTLVLPGFEGTPLYDVIVFFLKEVRDRSLTDRAQSISFSFLLALPPFLIFLFSLVPFIFLRFPVVSVTSIESTLYDLARSVTPDYQSYMIVHDLIYDFLYTQRTGLLSIAFLFGFYTSSNGIMGIMRSFDKDLPGFKKRKWWQARLTAIKLTSLLVLLLLITLVLIITQGKLMNFILQFIGIRDSFTRFLIDAARWLLIVLLFFSMIAMIYRFAPSTTKRWKFVTAGATFSTIVMILLTLAFSFFVTNFGRYNQIYGSIGTILVIMIWMYLNSFILLIGFELNTSIRTIKEIANERKEEKEEKIQGLS